MARGEPVSPETVAGDTTAGDRTKAGLVAPVEDECCDEENVDIDEEGEPMRYVPDPGQPSIEEIERHRCDHWPFRSWCQWCVKGRGTGMTHKPRGPSEVPRVGIDYFFITEGNVANEVEMRGQGFTDERFEEDRGRGALVKCIVIRCWESKAIFAHVIPMKGADEEMYVANLVVEALEWLGYARCILKYDNERAIKALGKQVERIMRLRGMDIGAENPVEYDSQSNGGTEIGVKIIRGLFRTHRLCLEERIGCKVPTGHPIMAWLLEHVSLILNTRSRGSDGRTPWERVRGRAFGQRVLGFGESVFYQYPKKGPKSNQDGNMGSRAGDAVFLGFNRYANSYRLWTDVGVVSARSLTRRMAKERWNSDVLSKISSTPWDLRGETPVEVEFEHNDEGDQEADARGNAKGPRQIRITRLDLEKHGYTVNCPQCDYNRVHGRGQDGRMHTRACRDRIVEAIKRTPKGKARVREYEARAQKFEEEHRGPAAAPDTPTPRGADGETQGPSSTSSNSETSGSSTSSSSSGIQRGDKRIREHDDATEPAAVHRRTGPTVDGSRVELPREARGERPALPDGEDDRGEERDRKRRQSERAGAYMVGSTAEEIAEEAMERGSYSVETILQVLEALDFPCNKSRRNVRPRGAIGVHGLLLGMYGYGGIRGVTNATQKYPWVTRFLTAAMRHTDPEFQFTSIQINSNYTARPHVDRNNAGCSYVVGVGDYTGGSIWVHDDRGSDWHTMEDGTATGRYQRGKSYPGTYMDVHNKFRKFDGTRLHYTTPFSGNRITVIFYLSSKYREAGSKIRKALSEMGFPADHGRPIHAARSTDVQESLGTWVQEEDDPVVSELLTSFGGTKQVVSEIYSPPRITAELRKKRYKWLVPGLALDLTINDPEDNKPWDFSVSAKRKRARLLLQDQRPYLLIGSPMCTMCSSWSSLNWAREADPENRRRRTVAAQVHMDFVVSLYHEQLAAGRYFLHEHPDQATSWALPSIRRILSVPGVQRITGDQCQYGAVAHRGPRVGGPVKKPTGFMSNSEYVLGQLGKRCEGKGGYCSAREGQKHVQCSGRIAQDAARYPRDLCRAVLRGINLQLQEDRKMLKGCFGLQVIGEEEEHEKDTRGPAHGFSGRYKDDVTGHILKDELVAQARREELEYFNSKGVWLKVPRSKARMRTGKPPITVRWVDINKGDDDCPNYRSRLVARQIKAQDQSGESFFAPAPPLEALRSIISMATTKAPDRCPVRDPESTKRAQISIVDVKRAYFNAKVDQKATPCYVDLPPEDEDHGTMCGELVRHMYGTRIAADGWQQEYSTTLIHLGFRQGLASPNVFHHLSRGICTSVHGDDFTSTGPCDQLDWLEKSIAAKYEISISPKIGSGAARRQARQSPQQDYYMDR